MLHNPYCSPSTSRATKTFGINYIPPGLVIRRSQAHREEEDAPRPGQARGYLWARVTPHIPDMGEAAGQLSFPANSDIYYGEQ